MALLEASTSGSSGSRSLFRRSLLRLMRTLLDCSLEYCCLEVLLLWLAQRDL
ncbi:hypothetical protein Hanom_Chr02g00099031 [Helianthus anomalus]